MSEERDVQEARGGGLVGKLVGLVVVLLVVYVGLFALWRTQLKSVDDIVVDQGVEDGLPDWIDGGHSVLIIDADSTIDTVGAGLFAPLVALEESMSETNYVSTDSWKFWAD